MLQTGKDLELHGSCCNASELPRGCRQVHTRFEKLRFSTVLSCIKPFVGFNFLFVAPA
ncbi:hypothetical protein HETIRDRAFT_174752 [Heterobasidion irregulare TC 32-1]|uniref:Uncharacterized protein n=1 Tax=Heterobasidion irregulare (strain TC 32-1) TaxID=747525 RepID=W4JT08_HETIT|nr:uncharacterized protein HETIRDRAFT_174752 [Heterobasidion irregulare TC 32-1]ETW76697.1 hypothetical protein HETIRDRAFT_174752 [Heterobasidion irregulare TC 32-1]